MHLDDAKRNAIEEEEAKEKRSRLTENVENIKKRKIDRAMDVQIRDTEYREKKNNMPYY